MNYYNTIALLLFVIITVSCSRGTEITQGNIDNYITAYHNFAKVSADLNEKMGEDSILGDRAKNFR